MLVNEPLGDLQTGKDFQAVEIVFLCTHTQEALQVILSDFIPFTGALSGPCEMDPDSPQAIKSSLPLLSAPTDKLK